MPVTDKRISTSSLQIGLFGWTKLGQVKPSPSTSQFVPRCSLPTMTLFTTCFCRRFRYDSDPTVSECTRGQTSSYHTRIPAPASQPTYQWQRSKGYMACMYVYNVVRTRSTVRCTMNTRMYGHTCARLRATKRAPQQQSSSSGRTFGRTSFNHHGPSHHDRQISVTTPSPFAPRR